MPAPDKITLVALRETKNHMLFQQKGVQMNKLYFDKDSPSELTYVLMTPERAHLLHPEPPFQRGDPGHPDNEMGM